MKRRLTTWITFAAGLYYLLEFLVPATVAGAPDSAGAIAPTVIPAALGPGTGPNEDILCYTGLAEDRPPRLLGVRLPSPAEPPGAGEGRAPATLLAPSFLRHDDYWGAQCAEFVAPDRLYYVGLGWDGRTPRVCLARQEEGRWIAHGPAILGPGPPGAWDSSGITWVSVLPPEAGSSLWRMWYVGRRGETGRVGFATSHDGVRWSKSDRIVLDAGTGSSIDSISVLPWADETRAWVVERAAARPEGDLVTVAVSATDGTALETPRPVAWQAPELRFGNLRAKPIPLRDARAVPGSDGPRDIRLYLSYLGADSRPRITVAENFPIAGEREPTVFSRQVKPLVEPGSPGIRTPLSRFRDRVDDLIVVVGAFAVGLGLIGLVRVHGNRVVRRAMGWPESIAFFLAAGAMVLFTLYDHRNPAAHNALNQGYALLFYGLYQPLGSSVFALLAAYLVSSSYRAFRVRTFDSALMATSATLIVLGQVPLGYLLTRGLPHSLQIPTVMAWVMVVMNNAVIRAVNFGLFVGAIATALRVWLRLDPATDL